MLPVKGLFIFSIPNQQSIYRKIERIIFRLAGKPAYLRYSLHANTPERISYMLKQHFFKKREHIYFGKKKMLIRLLNAVAGDRWSCSMIAFVFEKISSAED